jgi:hypothetical protein
MQNRTLQNFFMAFSHRESLKSSNVLHFFNRELVDLSELLGFWTVHRPEFQILENTTFKKLHSSD